MANPARQPGCGNVSFVIYMRYMLAIQACIFLYMGHIWKGLVNMYYLATPENSPSTMMAEPYARRLRCLISPELDRANHDIACGTVEIAPGSQSDFRSHEEGELFYCVQGRGHIRIDDVLYELYPDTAIYVPPFAKHQTYNDVGGEQMKLLFVLTPPFGGDRAIIAKWKSEQQ